MNIIIDILVPFARILRETEDKKSFANWQRVLYHALPLTFFIYWLFSLIPLVGTLIYALVIVPLSAKQHIKQNKITNKTKKASVLLRYLTVIIIGFGGIWGFIGHTFLADMVATDIGWQTGSPFQTELAFYHLGFGVAGLLVIWLRGHMVTGLVIAKSIFWYGAAGVHIYDAIVNNNYAPSNIGTPLIGDIIFPTAFLVILYLSNKKAKS